MKIPGYEAKEVIRNDSSNNVLIQRYYSESLGKDVILKGTTHLNKLLEHEFSIIQKIHSKYTNQNASMPMIYISEGSINLQDDKDTSDVLSVIPNIIGKYDLN
jgi:hypothetical protein